MDYAQAFAISAAGMKIERTRVDVAALNLANANTVQGTGGGAYRPMRVVARSGTGGAQIPFAGLVDQALERNLHSLDVLPVFTIEAADASPRSVHEPGHPMADDRGFVTYPGVDPAVEMVTLVSAMRAYEANVAAMNTARTLAFKALEIGGR